jgi:hypothetical protein
MFKYINHIHNEKLLLMKSIIKYLLIVIIALQYLSA